MSATRADVLVLAPHFPPEGGAAAARLSGLSRELRALGHRVRVVAPTPSYLTSTPLGPAPEEPEVRRVPVRRRARGPLGNALHQVRLRAALRRGAREALAEEPPDVVLVSSPPPIAALAGLGLLAGGQPVPVVVDVRDSWPDVWIEAGVLSRRSPAAWLLRRVQRRLCSRAAAVTTVTEGKLERLRAAGLDCVLVPNGVDRSWHEGAPEYAGGERPLEVLHAGNVGRAQDLGLLVRAAAAQARPPAWTATLIGDGEELGATRALAAATGAPVKFEPPLPRDLVRDRIAGCGCAFVGLRTAALADSVPSKLLDAWALGVPVVLSAAGESARLVEACGGGVVVPPGDVEALGSALARMAAASPGERRAMGARGRELVLSRHRREQAAAVLSRVLQAAGGRETE